MELKKNKDILFLVFVSLMLILDLATKSEVVESLGFILITLVFIYSVFNDKQFLKDERITYMKLFSGYISFMISIMIVCLSMVIVRYFGLAVEIQDLLRYIMLLMYLTFSVSYAVVRRKN